MRKARMSAWRQIRHVSMAIAPQGQTTSMTRAEERRDPQPGNAVTTAFSGDAARLARTPSGAPPESGRLSPSSVPTRAELAANEGSAGQPRRSATCAPPRRHGMRKIPPTSAAVHCRGRGNADRLSHRGKCVEGRGMSDIGTAPFAGLENTIPKARRPANGI